MKYFVNLYNTNATFHSFVLALEYAGVAFLSTYQGGVPTSRQGWIALGTGVAGALISAGKRWLVTNYATKNLELKNGGN